MRQPADEITDLVAGDGYDSSSTLVEITTFIRADQELALELLENAEEQQTGQRPDRALLIQEALDLLIKSRFVAVRLGTRKRELPP